MNKIEDEQPPFAPLEIGTRVYCNAELLKYIEEFNSDMMYQLIKKYGSEIVFVIKDIESTLESEEVGYYMYRLLVEGFEEEVDRLFSGGILAYHSELMVVEIVDLNLDTCEDECQEDNSSEPKSVDIVDPYFEQRGRDIGALVDRKQKAYGNAVEQTYEVIKVFMKPYYDIENKSYTIPQELLQHLLLQVRIIDKQNRIFNNPQFDLMDESPYFDLSGYGLLGNDMSQKMKNE